MGSEVPNEANVETTYYSTIGEGGDQWGGGWVVCEADGWVVCDHPHVTSFYLFTSG